MANTTNVPLSAEELDKLEAIVRRAYLADEVVAMISPGKMFDLIAQARAARPKREMPPEMKAAIKEAHKTGATSALLPNGSAVFINYGHDYGDNDHLCCTACGGSGHIEDQQARAATVASVEDARDAVLEEAAQLLEQKFSWSAARAPIGEACDAIRALKSSATQEGK